MSIRASDANFFEKISLSLQVSQGIPILNYKKNYGYSCEQISKIEPSHLENFERSSQQLLNLMNRKIATSVTREPQLIRQLDAALRTCHHIERIAKNVFRKSRNIRIKTHPYSKLESKAEQFSNTRTKIVNKIISVLRPTKIISINIDDFKNSSSLLLIACEKGFVDLALKLIDSTVHLNTSNKNGQTPLLVAIALGLDTVAMKLIEKKADVNLADKNGNSALICACCYKLSDIAIKLVEAGADPNQVAPNGTTALMIVCTNGAQDVAIRLIEEGTDIDQVNKNGYTALMYACEGSLPIVAFRLIDDNADIHQVSEDGLTALMFACLEGLQDVALRLMDDNADIHQLDKSGYTALMGACEGSLPTVALRLIEEGADIDQVDDKYGDTALIIACQKGLQDVALTLIEKGADLDQMNKEGDTALIIACQNGLQDVALALIEKGADLDQMNKNGNTALIIACQNGLPDVALALIEKGADLDQLNIQDVTALIIACAHKLQDVALSLIDNNADIHHVDNIENTALIVACQNGLHDVALRLIDDNVDIDQVNKFGWTALMGACFKGLQDIAMRLIDDNANIHQVNKDGDTALILACKNGLQDVALILIEEGTDLDQVNADGNTALMTACSKGLGPVILKLIQAGADITKVNRQGETLLHFACKNNGLTDVVQLLLDKIDIKKTLMTKNILQNRPLEMLRFAPNQSESMETLKYILKKVVTDWPTCIDELTFQNSTEFSEKLGSLMSTSSVSTKDANPLLEIAVLVQDISSIRKLSKAVSSDQFNTALEHISTKYGKVEADTWKFLTQYDINLTHLTKSGFHKIEIPKKPDTINVRQLLDIFDEINFSDPGAPEYYNPPPVGTKKNSDQIDDQAILREHLIDGFIKKIETKEVYSGTPKQGQALIDFYETMENATCHIIRHLNALPDTPASRDLKASTIIEFLKTAGYCGVRISTNATEHFEKIVLKIKQNYPNRIARSLAEYRTLLLQGFVTGEQSIHDYNVLLKSFGTELGIPGSSTIEQLDDPYAVTQNVDIKQTKEAFFKQYTAHQLVFEWVLPEINRSDDLRDLCIDWMKAQMPVEFEREKFNNIREAIRALTTRPEIEKKLGEFEIYIDKTLSPKEAIDAELMDAYLKTFLDQTTGKIHDAAILHSLVKLQILRDIGTHADVDADTAEVPVNEKASADSDIDSDIEGLSDVEDLDVEI